MTITEKIEKMEGRLSSEPMILKLSKLKGIYFFEQFKIDNPKFVAKVKEPINVDTFNKNMFRYDSFLKLELADDSHLATKNMRVAHAFASYVKGKLGITGEAWSTDRTKSKNNSIVSLHIMDDKLPIGIYLFFSITKDFKINLMEGTSPDSLLSPSGTLITNDYDDMTELKFIGGEVMEKVKSKKYKYAISVIQRTIKYYDVDGKEFEPTQNQKLFFTLYPDKSDIGRMKEHIKVIDTIYGNTKKDIIQELDKSRDNSKYEEYGYFYGGNLDTVWHNPNEPIEES